MSVRNSDEARAALEGGAQIIDVKEPRNGSLGKAEDATIEQIIQTVRSLDENCPVSVALGELYDWLESPSRPRLPCGVAYVKLGFSRCQSVENWRDQWSKFRQRLREGSSASPNWVAVLYADWQSAESPPPQEILDAVTENPCSAVLIDTFHKTGRSLVEILSPDELLAIAERVHQLDLPFAVAGSLRVEDLPQIQPLAPQIVAIRSAACRDGQRSGPICRVAVQNFREKLFHALPVPFPDSDSSICREG